MPERWLIVGSPSCSTSSARVRSRSRCRCCARADIATEAGSQGSLAPSRAALGTTPPLRDVRNCSRHQQVGSAISSTLGYGGSAMSTQDGMGFEGGAGGNWLPTLAVLGVVGSVGLGYFAWNQYELRAEHELLLVQTRKSNEALSAALDARELDRGSSRRTVEGLEAEVVSLRTQLARKAASQPDPKNPSSAAPTQAIERQIAADRAIASAFRSAVRDAPASVSHRSGDLVLTIGASALFSGGSATPSKEGRKRLRALAKALAKPSKGRSIVVAAHLDSAKFRNRKFKHDGFAFTSARAQSVVGALVAAGFKRREIAASGYAATRTTPKRAGVPPQRIEIIVERQAQAVAPLVEAQAAALSD